MDDEFDKNDVDVLVKAINVVPEVRLCASILKHARRLKFSYPVKDHGKLVKLLGDKKMVKKDGHSFSAAHIKLYVTKEQFPISNESELATAVYLGLCRCNEDMRWASIAPENAEELLKLTRKGGR